MPKGNVTDLATDQETHFGRLILSGTMTDRQAAEAAGLNPDTAAYTKAKPRVRDYMLEHREAVEKQLVEQEVDEQRRRKETRERVLARLWKIADLDPEMTRNSASAQMKAINLIVAIEALIPDRSPNRSQDGRAGSTQNQPAASHSYPAAWRSQQQEPTVDPPPASEQQQAASDPQFASETPDSSLPIAASAPVDPPQAPADCLRVHGSDFGSDTTAPFSLKKRFGPPR